MNFSRFKKIKFLFYVTVFFLAFIHVQQVVEKSVKLILHQGIHVKNAESIIDKH